MKNLVLCLASMLFGALITIACANAKPSPGASAGQGHKLAAKASPDAGQAATAAGITLQTPIVTTESAIAVGSLRVTFGANDAQTVAQLMYRAVDGKGNPLPGSPPVVVQLSAADLALFQSTPGTFRMGALAALQHNTPALAGPIQ